MYLLDIIVEVFETSNPKNKIRHFIDSGERPVVGHRYDEKATITLPDAAVDFPC